MRILITLVAAAFVLAGQVSAQDHDHETAGNDLDLHGPQFDLIRPYESHHRGIEETHGHAGHTSIEGYPFLHGIRTEIDFIERAFEFDLVRSRGADGGLVDEWEFESELVWAINDRTILIVGAPLTFLDPVAGPSATGLGDMELGVQFMAFNGRRDLLFFALNMTAPTGNADRDLGSGHTTLEPTALWLHDFGRGTYFQSRFGWEVPLAVEDVGGRFRYDLGLYHTLACTQEWRAFRFLTPLIEANGITTLNGVDSGQTVLDLTTGLRWQVRKMDEAGVGWSFPVTGARDSDWQLILSYRRHF